METNVVKCVECKYLDIEQCYGMCHLGYLGIVRPDDYCSRGERREEHKNEGGEVNE